MSTQTKIARVQRMLERRSGATLQALCEETGWQAHSVRAALARLRKNGHVIDRQAATGKVGTPVYRINAPSEASR